mgnify:CR=1 FL=1
MNGCSHLKRNEDNNGLGKPMGVKGAPTLLDHRKTCLTLLGMFVVTV